MTPTLRHDNMLCSLPRALVKALFAVPLILSFVLTSSAAVLIVPKRRARLRLLTRITAFYSRIGLRLIGLTIAGARVRRPRSTGQGQLVVANHLSWTDILVLSSLAPSLFITSVELRNTLFLGTLARLSGCLFVERRSASRLRKEIDAIADLLADGLSIVLFPEGTTSNGDAVRPFKAALFDPAVRAGTRVLPVCLRYNRVNGGPVTPENRERIYYYGGVRFFSHLCRVLGLRTVAVHVTFLDPLAPDRDDSPRGIANAAHRLIAAAYRH